MKHGTLQFPRNTPERNKCMKSEYSSLSERCCSKKYNPRMVAENTGSEFEEVHKLLGDKL